MTHAMVLVAAFLAGALVGGLYCLLLWRSVRHLLGGGRIVAFALMALSRVSLVMALVWLALQRGAPASSIVAAAAGFALVRLAATRRPTGEG